MDSNSQIALALLRFSWPLVLINILRAMSVTVHAIIIGRLLGASSAAAAAACSPLISLILSFATGLGLGATVLIGRSLGAKRDKDLRRLNTVVSVASFLFGLALGLTGALLSPVVFSNFGFSGQVLDLAVEYSRSMMFAMPVQFVLMAQIGLRRGVGDTLCPLGAYFVSFISSIILTPVLVQGFGPIPALGLHGVVVGNLAGSLIPLAWLGSVTYRRGQYLPLREALDKNCLVVLRELTGIGLPIVSFFVLLSLGELLLISLFAAYGANTVAAWGVASQVAAYAQYPALAMATATSWMAARVLGAGELFKIPSIIRTSLLTSLLLTASLVLLTCIYASELSQLFLADSAAASIAADLIPGSVVAALCFCISSTFSSGLRALGKNLTPTIISGLCVVFFLYPIGFIFSSIFGLNALPLSYSITYGVTAIMQVIYFRRIWPTLAETAY